MKTTQLNGRTDHRRGGTLGVDLTEPRIPPAGRLDLPRKSKTKLQRSAAHPQMRIILVAVDFTPASFTAASQALIWAKQLQASVLLLHVLNPMFSGRFVNLVTKQKVWAEARRRALARLNSLADFHANEGVVITCAVQDGLPEIEILRQAERMSVDMIVLGRRPRHPLGRWFLGSVSADIVDLAQCPVVLVNQSASSALRSLRKAWPAPNSEAMPQHR